METTRTGNVLRRASGREDRPDGVQGRGGVDACGQAAEGREVGCEEGQGGECKTRGSLSRGALGRIVSCSRLCHVFPSVGLSCVDGHNNLLTGRELMVVDRRFLPLHAYIL